MRTLDRARARDIFPDSARREPGACHALRRQPGAHVVRGPPAPRHRFGMCLCEVVYHPVPSQGRDASSAPPRIDHLRERRAQRVQAGTLRRREPFARGGPSHEAQVWRFIDEDPGFEG